ncbi:carbohydrate ABC transporter permease [Cohnella thailandensis]|jgi:ABC-type sugar transport system, permease component|uniref:Carbohydrate ABC transporter permease n=1 Tax=Cohnella thailandensis TaxID=557557 RepID=A0A841SZ82_9BACL|nr:carbohydrate ABC transporter permease [Cohnella thailandensis]MBB6636189.1 carbohydrate ABC transporter permease [Cohnella thailandensis]MBP1973842.1 multiple sugar transport system permease protein [Cohnella thailandensis]
MEVRPPLWVTLAKYISLLAAMFVVLFPIYSIFVGAFKTKEEYYQSGLGLPQDWFNFDNFSRVYEVGKLGLGFKNILIILVITLIGNIILGTMVAYALGRFDFKLKKLIMGMYLMATFIPMVTTQVATFTVVKELGLYNNLGAPILIYLGADVLQITIYLQFIRNIPKDLDESAMVEGASLFKIYRSIIFPLLTPATATLLILKTISVYNDFYTPYLYMPSQDLRVVSTALYAFIGPNAAQFNVISAGILIIFIPTVIVFLFMQRYIFSGVTSGAVK